MASPEDSAWAFDCPLIDFTAVDASSPAGFCWSPPPPLPPLAGDNRVGAIGQIADCTSAMERGSNKRPRAECCSQPSSKASREKLRRDKLNERFMELTTVLEPGKTPKMDKAAILNDAIRVVTDLRTEAKKLKDSNDNLQDKIKELKAEKNELREEKQRLKSEKDNLEQHIRALSARPTLVAHPQMIPAAFAPPPQGQLQGAGQKLMMPFIGYPGVPMWQFMQSADVDTSQDPESCPPVA